MTTALELKKTTDAVKAVKKAADAVETQRMLDEANDWLASTFEREAEALSQDGFNSVQYKVSDGNSMLDKLRADKISRSFRNQLPRRTLRHPLTKGFGVRGSRVYAVAATVTISW